MFVSLPIAFGQLPGGALWAAVFFVLLAVAALTSATSLLEKAGSHFLDWRGWSRRRAAVGNGGGIFLLGIPSALSGGSRLFGSDFAAATEVVFGDGQGKNWLDLFDYLASNWMLPLGGPGHRRVRRLAHGGACARTVLPGRQPFRAPILELDLAAALCGTGGVLAVFLHALGVF